MGFSLASRVEGVVESGFRCLAFDDIIIIKSPMGFGFKVLFGEMRLTDFDDDDWIIEALEWAGTDDQDTDTFDDDKDSIELFQNQSVITNLSSTLNH